MNNEINRAHVAKNKTFESQLSASARRMRKLSESNLSVPETIAIPQKRTRYWGWIATPTAAAIGLLVGLFIHRPAERQDKLSVPVVVASDNSGHSIVEDGTDYSLLVSL